MKKFFAMLFAVAFVAFQSAAYAASIQGTVKAVDAEAKKLEVTLADGSASSVIYSETTTWPADVTDPASLVGKTVTVSTDDATSVATSVA